MKLYLTEILKEANQAGFANQPDTSFNSLSPQSSMQAMQAPMLPQTPPMMAANPAMGGMMMPSISNPMNQTSLTPSKLTPSI